MLVELRHLVSAHGEFLATFGQQTRSEETSDSLDKRSSPQRWSPPPSVTQEPMVSSHILCHASNLHILTEKWPWIGSVRSKSITTTTTLRSMIAFILRNTCSIHQSPIGFILIKKLTLMVRGRISWWQSITNFLQITERADERQLVTFDSDEMKKTEAESAKTECESTEAKREEVEQTPAQVVDKAAPAVEEAPPAEPTQCLAKSEADPVEENKVESQRDMKTEETAIEAEKIEPKNDVAEAKSVVVEELVEAEAKPQTEVVEMACRGEATPKYVKSVEKDLLCLSQASDGRAIPPRMDATLLGF